MHITTTHLGKLINIMVHIDIDHKHIVTRYNRVQPQKKPIHPHGHLYYISNQLLHKKRHVSTGHPSTNWRSVECTSRPQRSKSATADLVITDPTAVVPQNAFALQHNILSASVSSLNETQIKKGRIKHTAKPKTHACYNHSLSTDSYTDMW